MASVSVKSYQFPSLTLEWLDLCSCSCYVQAKQKTIVQDSGHLLCQKWPKCHWRTSQMTNWCRWQNGESKFFLYSSWQKFCCAAQTDKTPFLLFFLYLKINLLLFFFTCLLICDLHLIRHEVVSEYLHLGRLTSSSYSFVSGTVGKHLKHCGCSFFWVWCS